MASVRLRFHHIRLEHHFSQTNTHLSFRPQGNCSTDIISPQRALALTNTERINLLGLFRAPAPPLPPLPGSFFLPSNTTQNIDTSPPPPFFPPFLSLHHSLSLLNTDRLSSPWSGFQILILSRFPPCARTKALRNIKAKTAEVNALSTT